MLVFLCLFSELNQVGDIVEMQPCKKTWFSTKLEWQQEGETAFQCREVEMWCREVPWPQLFLQDTIFWWHSSSAAAVCWWDDLTLCACRRINKIIPANPALAELELNFSGRGPQFLAIFSMYPKLIYTSGIKRHRNIRAEEFYTSDQDYKLFCKYEAVEIVQCIISASVLG